MGRKITTAVWVIAGALFVTSLATFFWLVQFRPLVPEPPMGFTKPLYNHGSIHYVTENEDILMNVLDYSTGAAIVLAVVLSWRYKKNK